MYYWCGQILGSKITAKLIAFFSTEKISEIMLTARFIPSWIHHPINQNASSFEGIWLLHYWRIMASVGWMHFAAGHTTHESIHASECEDLRSVTSHHAVKRMHTFPSAVRPASDRSWSDHFLLARPRARTGTCSDDDRCRPAQTTRAVVLVQEDGIA